MKKNKIIKYGTMGSYMLLYIIVAVVSLISSIHFFNLAHQGWMSTVLACSFELGQMACLFGALTRRKKEFDIVWIMFVVLTLFQCMANTYAAYIGLTDYVSWSELFGLTEMEPMDQKRIIAGISGAILPLIALGFVKCLTDYLNENDKKVDENVDEKIEEKVDVDKEIEEKVDVDEKNEEKVDVDKEIEDEMKEEEFDENDKLIIKDLLKNRIKKSKNKENKEFDGYILSDEEVKNLEKYGRSGASTTKKNVEDSLKELKEQTNG